MQRIQPDNNFDQFIIAVKNGKLEQVKTALKLSELPQYHINVNQHDISEHGMTALHFAAWHNYVEITKILLNNKADINCLDHRGLSPLMIAAIRGHENMVVLFLEQGNVIKINQQLNRIFGMTALHYAAFYGNEKIVKLLLEHGAYTDFKTSEPQYIDRGSKDEVYIRKDSTPLQIAAQRNFTNIVCVLLKHGANFENIIDRIPAIKNGRLHFFLQVIQEMLPMNNKDHTWKLPNETLEKLKVLRDNIKTNPYKKFYDALVTLLESSNQTDLEEFIMELDKNSSDITFRDFYNPVKKNNKGLLDSFKTKIHPAHFYLAALAFRSGRGICHDNMSAIRCYNFTISAINYFVRDKHEESEFLNGFKQHVLADFRDYIKSMNENPKLTGAGDLSLAVMYTELAKQDHNQDKLGYLTIAFNKIKQLVGNSNNTTDFTRHAIYGVMTILLTEKKELNQTNFFNETKKIIADFITDDPAYMTKHLKSYKHLFDFLKDEYDYLPGIWIEPISKIKLKGNDSFVNAYAGNVINMIYVNRGTTAKLSFTGANEHQEQAKQILLEVVSHPKNTMNEKDKTLILLLLAMHNNLDNATVTTSYYQKACKLKLPIIEVLEQISTDNLYNKGDTARYLLSLMQSDVTNIDQSSENKTSHSTDISEETSTQVDEEPYKSIYPSLPGSEKQMQQKPVCTFLLFGSHQLIPTHSAAALPILPTPPTNPPPYSPYGLWIEVEKLYETQKPSFDDNYIPQYENASAPLQPEDEIAQLKLENAELNEKLNVVIKKSQELRTKEENLLKLTSLRRKN